MITVFVLDDHELVRQGLRRLIDSQPDMEVVGEARTVAEALVRGPRLAPDVAVLDVRLPDGSGVTACRELRSADPGLACLMLTSYEDDDALLAAITAGAAGYVLKQIGGTDLLGAIRAVAAGRTLLDHAAKERVLARVRSAHRDEGRLSLLTGRERAVLDLIGAGLTNRQIGERLHLAEKTVKNYVSNVLAKIEVHSRTQAALLVTERRDGFDE